MRRFALFITQLYAKYRNLLLYGAIGCLNTVVDFGIYTILTMPAIDMHYLVANIISYHCGAVCSFFFNQRYNFKVRDRILQRFISFYASCLLALAFSEGMLCLLVSICGMHEVLAKIVSMLIAALCQFLYVKRYTFKR